jgi:hypothetical protein
MWTILFGADMFDNPIIANNSHALSYVVSGTKYLRSLVGWSSRYGRSNTGERPMRVGYERQLFSVHTMKKYRGSIGATPLILDLGIIWR